MIGIFLLVVMSIVLFLSLQKTLVTVLKFLNGEGNTIKTMPISILWSIFFFLNHLFNAMIENN